MADAKSFTWKTINLGIMIDEPGNAEEYRTGDWRSQIPKTDHDKCIRCGVCYIYCPDNARSHDEKGFYNVEEHWCKGCGICSVECPTGAIIMLDVEV